MSDPVSIEVSKNGQVFVTVDGVRKGFIKDLHFHVNEADTLYPHMEVTFEIPQNISEELREEMEENTKGWPLWVGVRVIGLE